MRRSVLTPAALALSVLAVGACNDVEDPVSFDDTPVTAEARTAVAGGVYLLSNDAAANEVLVFERASDGSLSWTDAVATGGAGTGGGLGSQGALALSQNGKWLLAVNAGSDEISAFRVGPDGLVLTDAVASGGDMPIGVALHGDLVYVVHGGAPNSITGFRLSDQGDLMPLAGSTRALSGAAVGPGQVGFTPDGRVLVVTEKGTNMITTYTVGSDGLASGPMSTPSAGQTPFGFSFNQKGDLIVSEAFGGAPNASTVSAYRVFDDGSVSLSDGPLATTESAACWIAISQDGRYAYATNTGSGTVTGLHIGSGGDLSLLSADGVSGVTGMGSRPIDADFSQGGRFLYVLGAGTDALSAFAIGADGSLDALPGVAGLPDGAAGVVAW